MDKCSSDPCISWNNNSILHNKMQKANSVQRTRVCHCLPYICFISRNDRYSPIKLRSTTGLLYNFVTNQRLPIKAIELHRGCPWDSMHINWGEVTLTNGHQVISGPQCRPHVFLDLLVVLNHPGNDLPPEIPIWEVWKFAIPIHRIPSTTVPDLQALLNG